MPLLDSLLIRTSSSNRSSSKLSSSIRSSMDSIVTPATLTQFSLPSLLIEDSASHTTSTKSSRRVFNSAVCSVCDDPLDERLTGERIIELPCNCAVHQQCLEIMGGFDDSFSSSDDIVCPVCDASQQHIHTTDNMDPTYSFDTPKSSVSASKLSTPPLSTACTCSPFSPSPASIRTPESEGEIRLYPTESSIFPSSLELRFKSSKPSSIQGSPIPARSPGHRYRRSSLSSAALLLPSAEIRQQSATDSSIQNHVLSLATIESKSQDKTTNLAPEILIFTDFNGDVPCSKTFTALVDVAASKFEFDLPPSADSLTSEKAAAVDILTNSLGWSQDRIDSLGELQHSNVLSVSKDKNSWKSLNCYQFTSCILCLEPPKEVRGIIFLQNDLVGISTLKEQDDYCLQLNLNVENFPTFYLRYESENLLRMWVTSLRKSLCLPKEALNLQHGDAEQLHPPLDVVIICRPLSYSVSYDLGILHPLIDTMRSNDRYCFITDNQEAEQRLDFHNSENGKYILGNVINKGPEDGKFLERALNRSIEVHKTKGRAQCTRSIIILDNFSLSCSLVGSRWLRDSLYDMNIGIQILGVGMDHNHSLALELSTCSNGFYTLTRDINQAIDCAKRCLRSLQTREFENVSVSLSLPLMAPLRVGKVSGCALDMKRTCTKDKSVTVLLGNINRDRRRQQFLVELIIDDENGLIEDPKSLVLLQADVAYERVMMTSQGENDQVSSKMATYTLNSQGSNNTREALRAIAQRKAELLVSEAFSRACLHLSYGKPDRATDALNEVPGPLDGLLISIKDKQGDIRNEMGKRGAVDLIQVLRCEVGLTVSLIDKDKTQSGSFDTLVKALTFLSCILHSQQCFSASSDLESHYATN